MGPDLVFCMCTRVYMLVSTFRYLSIYSSSEFVKKESHHIVVIFSKSSLIKIHLPFNTALSNVLILKSQRMISLFEQVGKHIPH